jgi:predicted DNA-binding transcriptional regulator AlpA
VRAARPIQSAIGVWRAVGDQIAEVVVNDLDPDDDLAGDHVPTITSLLMVAIDELRAIRKAVERGATSTSNDALIRPREFAAILAVSERELRRKKAKGELPKNVGTEMRPKWRRSDVEAHVAKLKPRRA